MHIPPPRSTQAAFINDRKQRTTVAAYLKLHSFGLPGCVGKTRSLLQILQLSLLRSTLCPLPPLFATLSLWEYFLFFFHLPPVSKGPLLF